MNDDVDDCFFDLFHSQSFWEVKIVLNVKIVNIIYRQTETAATVWKKNENYHHHYDDDDDDHQFLSLIKSS